ncbi:MAG: hypothetical protein WAU01_06145 [Saprospiraceae bacterium]
MPKIQLLQRKEIDDAQWDKCINDSPNRIVYALTWYLDVIADAKWTGYVYGDYAAVMPVIIKKKYFIPYVFSPLLYQQSGIFCSEPLNEGVISDFFKQLKKLVWKMEIKTTGPFPIDINSTKLVNHVMDIGKSYLEIVSSYHRNTIRNLRFADNYALVMDYSKSNDAVYNFIRDNDPTGILKNNNPYIKNIYDQVLRIEKGFHVSVTENNEQIAAGFFVIHGDRMYFLLCASNERGRQLRAMYFLIDQVIKKYAQSLKYFDFTGSNIPNIARRNEGFGASDEIYFQLSWQKIYF